MDKPCIRCPSKAPQQLGPRCCSMASHRLIVARSRARAAAAPNPAEASWRSALGPESRLPNVYWGAMSTTSLRRMSYYTALPPEEQVLLEGEATYRYVRQGTALWSALHAGRLTTSRLKDALGLRDRTAARIVGGPQYPEMGVLQAYNHLLQPPYVPPPPSGAAAGHRSETQALQLNEIARLSYNELMAAEVAEAAHAAEAGLQAESGSGRRPAAGSAARRRRPAGGFKGCANDDDRVEEGWSRADRRRVSELAALTAGAAGAVRMRLLWGSLQEASAVVTLASLLPASSQLEEVGLICLPDPRPWGVEPGELPPVGASPDALVTHQVPITTADIRAARADLRTIAAAAAAAAAGGLPADLSGAVGDDVSAAAPPELRRAAAQVARSLLRAALIRHTTHQQQQQQQPAMSPGGTASSSPPGSGPPPSGRLPVVMGTSGSSSSNGPLEAWFRSPPLFVNGCEEAVDWMTEELLRPEAPGGSRGAGAGAAPQAPSSSSSSPPTSASQQQQQIYGAQWSGVQLAGGAAAGGGKGCQGGDVAAVVQLREVVEVKNHCPFLCKGQRKARKRGVVLDYVVRDRGPMESLWPLWVPQLQAHMACSGVDSALLLSRSPSRGVRVFRMFRDDAYLSAAFDVLRELQSAHVARQQPPGSDPWVGRPGYDDFVQRNVAIARASEAVLMTSTTPQLPGADSSAFWELK